MKYLELDCQVENPEEFNEIIIAYLSDSGFTMFQEHGTGLKAYIPESEFEKSHLETLPFNKPGSGIKVSMVISEIKSENWNAIWESSFEPVIIKDRVVIRASHHDEIPGVDHQLVITPKMSFGTGHHQTTSLMVSQMLDEEFSRIKVADIGCGTAVLGILAEKLGAELVDCVDIDHNAIVNSAENLEINSCSRTRVMEGNAQLLVGNIYQIVMANINRNIILDDLPLYSDMLEDKGRLLLSGFYTEDLEQITVEANRYQLVSESHRDLDNWCCAVYVKN